MAFDPNYLPDYPFGVPNRVKEECRQHIRQLYALYCRQTPQHILDFNKRVGAYADYTEHSRKGPRVGDTVFFSHRPERTWFITLVAPAYVILRWNREVITAPLPSESTAQRINETGQIWKITPERWEPI